MAKKFDAYDYIAEKINLMKHDYPSLRNEKDYYIFSALFIKNVFYKNPELTLTDNDFTDIIVDGPNDCGIDILLMDPNSDEKALVIGQAKFCKTITQNEILEAMCKMANGYKDLVNGHYEHGNDKLSSRFAKLYDKVDEDSQIRFVFYTSAPKKRIDLKQIERKFLEQFLDTDAIEFRIFFIADVEKEIDDAARWKSIVESDKIFIDKANNHLLYGDNAAIVNVSAFSIKRLYAIHKTNLLALNLRYHITERKSDGVDNGIKKTIDENPESFWLKNNGITIICDDFDIDGREVHLRNFSIVNGGQTTYVLSKSGITESNDFWLPCKIIKTVGENKDEKAAFSLEIAQAANSQKPITQEDLKANSPEQTSFANEMRALGVFYQAKRGQKNPSRTEYPESYLKTKLVDVGKLCLAAIFQMPCVSRNKAKDELYKNRHYDYIFNKNQSQVAKICKELLYIDYYFKKKFLPKYLAEQEGMPNADNIIPFANKARTICIAFTALAARYHQGNITDKDLNAIFVVATAQSNSATDDLYKAVRDLGSMQSLFPQQFLEDMNLYDAALDKLFTAIIEEAISAYSYTRDNNPNLSTNSFLQNDRNYYRLLKGGWKKLKIVIQEVFSDV